MHPYKPTTTVRVLYTMFCRPLLYTQTAVIGKKGLDCVHIITIRY